MSISKSKLLTDHLLAAVGVALAADVDLLGMTFVALVAVFNGAMDGIVGIVVTQIRRALSQLLPRDMALGAQAGGRVVVEGARAIGLTVLAGSSQLGAQVALVARLAILAEGCVISGQTAPPAALSACTVYVAARSPAPVSANSISDAPPDGVHPAAKHRLNAAATPAATKVFKRSDFLIAYTP